MITIIITGTGWGYAFTADKERIYVDNRWSDVGQSGTRKVSSRAWHVIDILGQRARTHSRIFAQVNTCILLSRDGERIVRFGDAAKQTYIEQCLSEEGKNDLYFERVRACSLQVAIGMHIYTILMLSIARMSAAVEQLTLSRSLVSSRCTSSTWESKSVTLKFRFALQA